MRNWSIQRKLMAFVGCAVLALIVFALVAFRSMSEIAVGSPLYQRNRAALAVASHFEINTQGIQSVHAMAIEAEEADTVAERQSFDKAIRAAHQEFERGHQYYLQIVPAGPLRDVIAGPEYQSAEDWYNAAEREFLPLLEKSDVPDADQIRTTKLARAYRQNVAAIEQITKLTDAWNEENDKASNDLVRSRTWLLTGCGLLALVLLTWLGLRIRAEVVSGIARTMEGIEALANCDLTQEVEVTSDDELGRMAAAMQKTTATLRQVLSAIHASALRLAGASTEMNTTASESSRQAREHDREAAQAAAAMSEMLAAIHEVTDGAKQAATMAQGAEEAAAEGAETVREAIAAVQGIAQATRRVEERITALGTSSAQINKIVVTIEEIAGQTNLLALNAAIEAARAGENGRGFAVVAGEVRRLAERTTVATREISQMVGRIQNETLEVVTSMQAGSAQVETGLERTAATVQALDRIHQLSQKSGDQAAQIASSASQQAAAISELTQNITRLSDFVHHSSATSEENAAASRSLAELAAKLNQETAGFRMPEGLTRAALSQYR